MKHFLSILFISLLFALPSHADKWVLVTQESQIEEGVDYIITYTNSKGCYHTLYSEQQKDTIYQFKSNNYYDSTYWKVKELVGQTTLFRFVKTGSNWYLYSQADEKYVSKMTSNPISLFSLRATPNENCKVSFEISSNELVLKVGEKYFEHQKAAADYRLNTSSKGLHVLIYKRTDGEDDDDENPPTPSTTTDTLYLKLTEPLTATSFKGTAILERTFESGYYNTIILPFKVSNFNSIFGSGVKAYQATSTTDSTIVFNELSSGSALTANTPYLLMGSFATSPYVFENVSFTREASNTLVETTVGNATLCGVYAEQKVGGTSSYILWKDNFYICTSLPNMVVEPYKWYINLQQSSSAKAVRVVFENTTDIASIPTTTPVSHAIYSIQGIRMSQSWETLPKGIYIIDGKKLVKR